MTKRITLLFLFLVMAAMLISGCGSKETEEITKTYPNGDTQEIVIWSGSGDSKFMAKKTGYHRNGNLSFEEIHNDSGIVSYDAWWAEGRKKAFRTYANGKIAAEDYFDSDGVRHLKAEEISTLISDLANYQTDSATENDIAVIETSAGTIKLIFFIDYASGHADNFKRLANFGFYDSTTFHRVIPDFMIQAGDILSRDNRRSNDGNGGPGYTIDAEFNARPHRKGRVGMARTADPNSAGSQWYIALKELTWLDNKYTIFAEVVEGLEVVDAIAAAATDSRDNPVNPQRILSIRVVSKQIAGVQ